MELKIRNMTYLVHSLLGSLSGCLGGSLCLLQLHFLSLQSHLGIPHLLLQTGQDDLFTSKRCLRRRTSLGR